MKHFPVEPWAVHTERYLTEHGLAPLPRPIVAIAPNVARPRSRAPAGMLEAVTDGGFATLLYRVTSIE